MGWFRPENRQFVLFSAVGYNAKKKIFKLILNGVKIQNSKKPFKAKQVNIEAIKINFFLPSSYFFIFFAL
jgi:hypothetical protein